MDLKGKMKEESFLNFGGTEKYVVLDDAIKIAKQYAIEMCEKQRINCSLEICSALQKHKWLSDKLLTDKQKETLQKQLDKIENAPLPQELREK